MSSFLKLDSNDLIKGLVVAFLTAVLSYIGNLTTLTDINPVEMIKIVVIALLAYLSKNLLTNADGKFLGVLRTR